MVFSKNASDVIALIRTESVEAVTALRAKGIRGVWNVYEPKVRYGINFIGSLPIVADNINKARFVLQWHVDLYYKGKDLVTNYVWSKHK